MRDRETDCWPFSVFLCHLSLELTVEDKSLHLMAKGDGQPFKLSRKSGEGRERKEAETWQPAQAGSCLSVLWRKPTNALQLSNICYVAFNEAITCHMRGIMAPFSLCLSLKAGKGFIISTVYILKATGGGVFFCKVKFCKSVLSGHCQHSVHTCVCVCAWVRVWRHACAVAAVAVIFLEEKII